MCSSSWLHLVPIALFLLGVTKLLSTYVIAVLTHFVEPVLPYISTAASGYPQRVTYMLMAFLLTFLLAGCVYIRFVFVKRVLLNRFPLSTNTSFSTLRRSSVCTDASLAGKESCCEKDCAESAGGSKNVGDAGLKVEFVALRRFEGHDAEERWRRLNVAIFANGVILSVVYVGACCIPENIQPLRTLHMLLALLVFLTGTAYIFMDSILSLHLLKLAHPLDSSKGASRVIGDQVIAGTKLVSCRLAIVVFVMLLCFIGFAAFYFADDPVEQHFGDYSKPKTSCNAAIRMQQNLTAEGNTTQSSEAVFCKADLQAAMRIVSAAAEWLVTLSMMVYLLTFASEFRHFRLKQPLEANARQRQTIAAIRAYFATQVRRLSANKRPLLPH